MYENNAEARARLSGWEEKVFLHHLVDIYRTHNLVSFKM